MQKSKLNWIMVKLASPEVIDSWSHGAVDHPDTINYRTGKPKQKWLFCESIFGPIKNYECSCGKYKWIRYKWIVCERCGVEITSTRVRRERMGHIDLATPVIHVWYQNNTSWWVHHLLGISWNEIHKILNFVKYVVVNNVDDKSKNLIMKKIEKEFEDTNKNLIKLYEEEKQEYLKNGQKNSIKNLDSRFEENKKSIIDELNRVKSIVLDLKFGSTVIESDYRNFLYKFDEYITFKSWPQAIYEMLKSIDIKKLIKEKLSTFLKIKSADLKKKTFVLIKLLINLYTSGVKPSDMIITKLPVIPPDIRPVVQLDGGRFASSDVNLYYRRVLMRNIRLRKMIQVWMPDVVKKNEIRLLQESVNNLFVWEKNTGNKAGAGVKLFKSLSDMLSWKEWIFRNNLLGKRVDYSGRSVITWWPDLSLDECWIPLYIAMKIFTPFIIWKLIDRKIVYTPKQAEKIIKDWQPIALELLNEVIKDKYILLNRAPTLHRLWIEAFKIKLMPWKTIRLHPLVCSSFNADFDGDQMAVHLPISEEAQKEARELIAATKNILKPASWQPTITHSQDIVLGIYYLTDDKTKTNKIIWYYGSIEEIIESYHNNNLSVKDTVFFIKDWIKIETTVWRIIFNSKLPKWYDFINESVWKKQIAKILNNIFDVYWQDETVRVADAIKNIWFKYATIATITFNILDIKLPKEIKELLWDWDNNVDKVYTMYYRWFLSEAEKHNLIVRNWTDIRKKIEVEIKKSILPGSDIFNFIDSWARWSYWAATQISGMKWLVLNPRWEIIELPVKWNYLEWLSPIEYFISIHASRKGKADTALKTAESGYLTRKLCDACQEIIVREEDCETKNYIIVSRKECEIRWESFDDVIFGRVIFDDIKDVDNKKTLEKWTLINKSILKLINSLQLDFVKVRSPLTCMSSRWVCQKCYGMDLSTRKIVDVWSPIGVIAAQSIWEPATQLTLNTFHEWWWVASKWEDMVQWLERVNQLFEIRTPKNPAIISPFDGNISIFEEWKMKFMILESDYIKKTYSIKSWYKCELKIGDVIPKGWIYATMDKSKLQSKEWWEVLDIKKDHIVFGIKETVKKNIMWLTPLKTKRWEKILKWEILTTGAVNIQEYKDLVSDFLAQKYIIDWIKKVYGSQWQSINDKHIELVVKQLFSKVFIRDSWESSFVPWSHVKYEEFVRTNEDLIKKWKKQSIWYRLASWLTTIAKSTDSWLSAASFQETVRVMVDASLKWSIDYLSDLKSNVIIWNLLPLWEEYRKQLEEEKENNKL